MAKRGREERKGREWPRRRHTEEERGATSWREEGGGRVGSGRRSEARGGGDGVSEVRLRERRMGGEGGDKKHVCVSGTWDGKEILRMIDAFKIDIKERISLTSMEKTKYDECG
jgi:hypothetical protein